MMWKCIYLCLSGEVTQVLVFPKISKSTTSQAKLKMLVTQRIDHKGKKGSHEHVCLPALLTTRGPQSRNLFHSPSSRWWSSSRPRQLIGPRLCKVVVVVCAALTDRQMQKTDHPYSSEYHIILQAHSVFWAHSWKQKHKMCHSHQCVNVSDPIYV